MDAISYSHASAQAAKIDKFIADPKSTNGIVTLPTVVDGNETITIPAGRQVVVNELTVASGSEVIVDTGAVLGVISGGQISQTKMVTDTIQNIDGTVVIPVDGKILGGDATKVFKAADGVASYDVVNRGQLSIVTKSFTKPLSSVLFTKTSPADLTIPIGFKVAVGTELVEATSTTTVSLNTNLDAGTKTAGTDYYVYAKADSTFYISADKTITADRLIGGFHYGLIPETEALTGNKTEADMVAIRGINQYSFWDLKFRPVANPEGMVFVNGRWYDIYLLNSEHITNGSSKAGAVIAGGVADTTSYRAIPKIPLEFGGDGATNYGKFTWFQACEIAKSHSKELISYSEFLTIAYGVTEQKSSSTDGYEVNVGKVEHYSNLTSKWGIEQASGTQWLWSADVGGNRDEGSTAWAWRTGLTDNRGDIYALHNNHVTAVLLGASRADGVNAGSRASHWGSYVWNSSWSVGSRFACDHLELV